MYEYNEEVRKIEIKLPEIIRKGCTGPAVKDWQALLLAEGYKLPEYGIDGDFGDETDKATRKWQYDVRLEVDGVVGPLSWERRLNDI